MTESDKLTEEEKQSLEDLEPLRDTDEVPEVSVRMPSQQKLAFCKECGNPFYQKRHDQIFCSDECKKTRHVRKQAGGLKMYEAAIKWRIERGKDGFAAFTAIVDDLAFEERRIKKKREAVIEKAREELARRGREAID